MDLPVILHWIARLGITSTVAAAAGVAAFQFLGKKWLDAHFAERLEKLRYDQNQEIERLRYRINALMDRTAKLHQYEFEVLPVVWGKLSIAFAGTIDLTSRLQSYPDLDSMNDAQYSTFVDECDLVDWEKDELRRSDNRNSNYQKIIFWHRLGKVKRTHAEFHNYFIDHGIFIQPELKEKIRTLSNMMYDAFTERELAEQYPTQGEDRLTKGDRLHRDGPAALQAIEKEVQSRLWDANKLD